MFWLRSANNTIQLKITQSKQEYIQQLETAENLQLLFVLVGLIQNLFDANTNIITHASWQTVDWKQSCEFQMTQTLDKHCYNSFGVTCFQCSSATKHVSCIALIHWTNIVMTCFHRIVSKRRSESNIWVSTHSYTK